MGTPDSARDLNNIISQLPKGTFVHIQNFGYTTVLGATYAALFPNGFDRMTMDGTVDAQKVYNTGGNDPVSVQDSEKALGAFFDSCAASTPCTSADVGADCDGCYFWASTPAGVKV
jgi:hypothetical protein